jgi:hypothetical protein
VSKSFTPGFDLFCDFLIKKNANNYYENQRKKMRFFQLVKTLIFASEKSIWMKEIFRFPSGVCDTGGKHFSAFLLEKKT